MKSMKSSAALDGAPDRRAGGSAISRAMGQTEGQMGSQTGSQMGGQLANEPASQTDQVASQSELQNLSGVRATDNIAVSVPSTRESTSPRTAVPRVAAPLSPKSAKESNAIEDVTSLFPWYPPSNPASSDRATSPQEPVTAEPVGSDNFPPPALPQMPDSATANRKASWVIAKSTSGIWSNPLPSGGMGALE